jgi:hypothetical protein
VKHIWAVAVLKHISTADIKYSSITSSLAYICVVDLKVRLGKETEEVVGGVCLF